MPGVKGIVQASQERTSGTEQTGENILDRTTRTGYPGQNMDMDMDMDMYMGQNNQDMTVGTTVRTG